MTSEELAALGASVSSEVAMLVDEELAAFHARGGIEETKGIQDLVTDADRTIEHRLVETLLRILPESKVRGEEGASAGNQASQLEWVLDPVDGTVNFSRGLGFFSSVAALLDGGQPVLSVVYLPETKECVVAARGAGCTCSCEGSEPQRLHTERRSKQQSVQSLMITPKLTGTARDASVQYALGTLRDTLGFRVLVSQAYEAVKLAAGGIDAVVSFHSSGGWSRDAARLVCEEAGGTYRVLRADAGSVTGFVLASTVELLDELTPDFSRVGYTLAD